MHILVLATNTEPARARSRRAPPETRPSERGRHLRAGGRAEPLDVPSCPARPTAGAVHPGPGHRPRCSRACAGRGPPPATRVRGLAALSLIRRPVDPGQRRVRSRGRRNLGEIPRTRPACWERRLVPAAFDRVPVAHTKTSRNWLGLQTPWLRAGWFAPRRADASRAASRMAPAGATSPAPRPERFLANARQLIVSPGRRAPHVEHGLGNRWGDVRLTPASSIVAVAVARPSVGGADRRRARAA